MPADKVNTDRDLIQIVDAALADVTARAGRHLVCRPGCSQCCTGYFAINSLDARRLQKGLEELAQSEPGTAERVRARVRESLERLDEYPGDRATGALDESAAGQEEFEGFGNDEVCPVLDPLTQTCDLYEHRPMTCRVFGPPVASEGGLGMCDLCFTDASLEEIQQCELVPDPEHLEEALLEDHVKKGSPALRTIVPLALRDLACG